MINRETVLWHVYPMGACGAPVYDRPAEDHAPRLRRLTAWVDYVADLGCTGMLLGPIFESAAHGYDTLDHFHIDSRLGTEEDFSEFMQACQRRGLDVLLDGVFNHVAASHPAVLADEGLVSRTAEGQIQGWEGDTTLAELDHSNPQVEDLVVKVMNYWLSRGIAGWRLDVAYSVPTEFWARVCARVRQRHPQAFFLGEMIHGDYVQYAEAATLDSMTQYELWKAVWSSLRSENFWELDHALGRHKEFSRSLWMNTFIGNHDVDRIVDAAGSPERARLAAVALLTLPGLPSIYYGDEWGERGIKGEGERADVPLRPELPASAESVDKKELEFYRRLIALRREYSWVACGEVEVEEKTNDFIRYRVSPAENQADEPATSTMAVELRNSEELQAKVWVGEEEVFAYHS